MKTKTRALLTSLLLVVALAPSGWAWWAYGHRTAVLAALEALPGDVPTFFADGGQAISFYSDDPDAWKNKATPALQRTEGPEHYLDMEYLGDRELPKTRGEYQKLCQEIKVDPEKAGYLPYATQEWYERLLLAFAEYRKWPDNKEVRAKTLYVAGILAHYAGDAANPLHTTIHFDGRTKPGEKSPRSGIHDKVDALPESLGLIAKDLQLPAGFRQDQVFENIVACIRQAHTLVDEVYNLEAKLPDAGRKTDKPVDPDVRKLGESQMLAAATLIRTLYYAAWRNSEGVKLPDWHAPVPSDEARPPLRLALNNDEPYAAALKALLNAKPGDDATDQEMLRWHLQVSSAAFNSRDYKLAEEHVRKALAINPNLNLYANLSVYLGKQGRYKEAEEAAKQALLRVGAYTMHTHMVLASWEWEMGKTREAIARIESFDDPEDFPQLRHTYFGCRACFYATAGDERKVEAAVKLQSEMEGQPDGVSDTRNPSLSAAVVAVVVVFTPAPWHGRQHAPA